MCRLSTIAFCFIFFVICGSSSAQDVQQSSDNNTYDFRPREKVIFEDDFSDDKLGGFPSKWQVIGAAGTKPPKHCQVQKEDNDFILKVSDADADLEPKMKSDSYLTDSFTLEFDFIFGAPNADFNIDFRVKHSGNRSYDWLLVKGDGEVSYLNINKAGKLSEHYPGTFEFNTWHHFAISDNHGVVKLYIDHYQLLTARIYYGFPLFSFGLHCTAPGSYKNFRLATGKENNIPVPDKKTNDETSVLKVFPNPDQGSFTINVTSANKENTMITITNMAGKLIKTLMTTTNTDTEIKLDVPAGIYNISAVTKRKTLTAKIALE